MNKSLVCYFSASGVTKKVAENIATAIGGECFEIEPVEKYTSEDLDWMDKESRSSLEMADKSSRPKIEKRIENVEEYDTIVLGFPVWWYTAPMIIHTFLEENSLEGKNIYVFVTSGSSSEEGSFTDLKNMYPNLTFVSAKRFTGKESLEEYKNLIKEK